MREPCVTVRSAIVRSPQEEGGYEYASYHPKAENSEKDEAHAEAIALYQPIGEEASQSSGGESGGSFFFIGAGHGSHRPRHGHSGSANEGGCPADSRGRSCGSRGGGAVTCGDVGAAVGGVFGGLGGGALTGGAGGEYAGATAGGYIGYRAGEAICGN
jgi:hypothetical protein